MARIETKSGSLSCQTATDILVVGAISLNSHLLVPDLKRSEQLVVHFLVRIVYRKEGMSRNALLFRASRKSGSCNR